MRRTPKQTHPNKIDFLGGHTQPGEDDPYVTALREANEEILLSIGEHRVPIERGWLQTIGEPYEFTVDCKLSDADGSPIGRNRERSTLFALQVPWHPGFRVRFHDEDMFGFAFVDPRVEFRRLDDLITVYAKERQDADVSPATSTFADGAGRVLLKCARNPELTAKLKASCSPDSVG